MLFLSVRFHSDSLIRRSVENVLSLKEHTLSWMNLLPDAFLEPHTASKQGLGLINQKFRV